MGLEQLRELQARMDPLLRAQGLTRGTRRRADDRARQGSAGISSRTPTPAAPRSSSIVNGRVADIRTRLPRAFATLVPGNLIIKRVPVEIEAGAPGGYAAAGTIDGSVPGNYYINLRDTAHVAALLASPTLTYHEGIPGHIWQGEYTYKLPLIRSLLAFNAYSEGWALYAEQLADELGVYDGDPLGQLGYLQSLVLPRLPPGRRHRAPRQALDPRPGDRVVRRRPTARPSRRCRARSTAIAPGPARPAATRSAIARSTGFATRRKAALGGRFDLGPSTMRWCWAATCR